MASNMEASLTLNFDVDIMILDYLVYMACKAMIKERVAQRRRLPSDSCESYLQMVDVFLPLFKTAHGRDNIPDEVLAKLQILTFGNLLLRRYTVSEYLPSPEALARQRESNAARAKEWLQQNEKNHQGWLESVRQRRYLHDSLPGTPEERQSLLEHMAVPDAGAASPSSSHWNISLLDILPGFMDLYCGVAATGVRIATEDEDEDELLLQLLREMPLLTMHAALERILIYGDAVPDAVKNAFVWVLMGDPNQDSSLHEDAKGFGLEDMLTMVCDAGSHPDSIHELKKLLYEYPLFELEGTVIELLESLLDSLGIPILTQLERGKLDDITDSEMEDLMERIGIS